MQRRPPESTRTAPHFPYTTLFRSAAKKRLVAGAVYARDNLSTGPRVIGAALTTGGSLEQVESWPERIETVTAAEVNAALESVLRDEQSVTSYLLPEPTT